jgi:radical SAM superfamily enzyme YgiQ (UPF0313 family)
MLSSPGADAHGFFKKLTFYTVIPFSASLEKPLKLLLIQPPTADFYDTEIRLQPLGLCMLKGTVKKFLPFVEVKVRDYHRGHGRRTKALPDELLYLRDYYRHPDNSPFCTFHHYYHFGASCEDLAKDVAGEKPDLVGISSLFSPYHHEALACAREIKKHFPVPILMGGSHVSSSPLSVLNDRAVDFIIRGEGEKPLVEFLKTYASGGSLENVPNLGFKRRRRVFLNDMEDNYPLDQLPSPDFSDLNPDLYRYKGKRLCFIATSRGCPHRCTFCSVRTTFGPAYRRRSPEKVLVEIRTRFEQGYRVFDFEDDNLSFHREDFRRILKSIIYEIPRGDVEFLAMNGLSYLSLDAESLGLMARAGFKHLDLSLVTVNRGVLKALGRPHRLEKFLEVVHLAHGLGFNMVSYQILGLPLETLEDMTTTMAVLAGLPVLIGASLFYLSPGCPLAETFKEMTPRDLIRTRSTAMALETDFFCRDDLYTLFVSARILNFLKGLRFHEKEIPLSEALSRLGSRGRREKLGGDILQRLFRERRLYASTREGLKPFTGSKQTSSFRSWKKQGAFALPGGVGSPSLPRGGQSARTGKSEQDSLHDIFILVLLKWRRVCYQHPRHFNKEGISLGERRTQQSHLFHDPGQQVL